MIFWAISTLQISTNISFELVFKVGGTYLFDHITRIRRFGLKKLIWWSIKSRTLSYDMSTMDLMMNGNIKIALELPDFVSFLTSPACL